MPWQDESWQLKSLISRQPGSSLGHVPTRRGGPRSGKGPMGVRNFSYEVAADASADMVGGGLARTPTAAGERLTAPGAGSRPPGQRLSGLSESFLKNSLCQCLFIGELNLFA